MYVYVNSRPTSLTDPSGLQPEKTLGSTLSEEQFDSVFKSQRKDKYGCVRLYFEDFMKLVGVDPMMPPIEIVRGAWRGCVGITSVHQMCKIPAPPYEKNIHSPFQLWPEQAPDTTCYLDREPVERHQCPKNKPVKVFFVIEGKWKDGKPPENLDTIPPDTIETISSPGGDYNYISMIGKYCVAMNHVRRDKSGKPNTDPNVPEGPNNKQTITICESEKGLECSADFPAHVHCVTCKCAPKK